MSEIVPSHDQPIIGARVSLFNWRLRKARIAAGWKAATSFAEFIPMAKTTYNGIECLRLVPSQRQITEIATALDMDESFLFPDEIRKLRTTRKYAPEFYLAQDGHLQMQEQVEQADLAMRIRPILERLLTPRQQRVIELRYGFGREAAMTLDELSGELGVTRERARQIEQVALEKLRRHGQRDLYRLNSGI